MSIEADPYEINVELDPVSKNENEHHRLLHIRGRGYESQLADWTDPYPDGAFSGSWWKQPMPDVPEEARNVAAHVGLVLELTGERLHRELLRASKECRCTQDEPASTGNGCRVGVHAVQDHAPYSIWELEYDETQPDSPSDRTEAERFKHALETLTFTSSISATVPAGAARLWVWRAKRLLAEADAEIGRAAE